MTSFIFISILILAFLFYVLLKFFKRKKEKINVESVEVKEGRKFDDMQTPACMVDDNLEKAEEVERIEFEKENAKKLVESQPEEIPQNICLKGNQDEITGTNEKNEENYPEKDQDKNENVEMPQNKNYENILTKENFVNPDDLMNRFVGYIYRSKLAKIDDISTSLKSDKEETINKLRDIEIQGNSIGFLDDKGFYMSLNERELDV